MYFGFSKKNQSKSYPFSSIFLATLSINVWVCSSVSSTPFNVIFPLSELPFCLTFLGSGSGDGVGRWWIESNWTFFKDVLCSLLTGELLSASYANIECVETD